MDKRAIHTLTDDELLELLAELERLKDQAERALMQRWQSARPLDYVAV